MEKNKRKFAVAGIIGGILYFIASALVHVGTGMTGENPDPGWLNISNVFSGLSELLALAGSVCILLGFISMYKMAEETLGKTMRNLIAVSAVGIVGMALFHGNINCIEPIIYRTLVENRAETIYSAMDGAISGSFALVDLIILVTFYLQIIPMIYGILSGKFGVKKWLIIFNPVVGLIIGIIFGNILPTPANGIAMGMRNLGEGLIYIIPALYWKKA